MITSSFVQNTFFTLLLLGLGASTLPAQTTWTLKTPPKPARYTMFLSVVGTDTGFVAATNRGTFRTTNGNSWTSSATAFDVYMVSDLDYRAGKFWASAFLPYVLRSSNGTSWTAASLGKLTNFAGSHVHSVDSSVILATGTLPTSSGNHQGIISRSTNGGASWSTVLKSSTSPMFGAMASNGSRVVAAGLGGIYLSTNKGAKWSKQPLPADLRSMDIESIVYGGGRFIAVGSIYVAAKNTEYPVVLRSSDGTAWSGARLAFPGELWGIAYGNGQYVAVGNKLKADLEPDGALVLTSPNGTGWVSRPLPTSGGERFLYSVAYCAAQKRFLAVGEDAVSSSSSSLVYTSGK